MLQHISELPAHVLGIHAVGIVNRRDIDGTLRQHLQDMVKQRGEINYLLIIETKLRNFSLGALIAYMALILKYYAKWNKVAVVTDERSIYWLIGVIRFLIPGVTKRYTFDGIDKAIKWVAIKT